jgi:hypothetical protein
MVVLWALQNARSTSRAPSSAPSSARRAPPQLQPSQLKIPGLDVYTEPTDQQLSRPTNDDTADDRLWAMYAVDSKRVGPKPTDAELLPVAEVRKLSEFERWALEPYFPQLGFLLETVVHNGLNPPWLGAPEPDTYAITDENREIWVLHKPRGLWTRWWLSLLAHELSHVRQMQMGMTREQVQTARRDHGYANSPIEVQARAVQRRVLRGLTYRSREFYRSREQK